MKQLSIKILLSCLRICIVTMMLVILSLFLFSFTANRAGTDFLKQLGISKTNADTKITSSILGGYLDQYGLSNAKNIALGDRAAVVKDLLTYSKQFVNSSAFTSEYNSKKENAKPKQNKIASPEEMQQNMVDLYRKSVAETEANIKKADESVKKYLVTALEASKKQLKEAEDPNNKYIRGYRESYVEMVEANNAAYKSQLSQWQDEYPADHLLFVKKRLQEFMNETSDIDFNATLTERNGKKYFVNKEYEHKSYRWKMAYRAGRDAIETARTMVQQWINEIK